MRKASGDLQGALAAVDSALAISPLDFSGLLSRAVILEGLGDPNAGEEFGNALAQLPPDEAVPPPMMAAVAHARKRRDDHRRVARERLRASLQAELDANERKRAERLITNRVAADAPLPSGTVRFSLSGHAGNRIP